MQSSLPKKRFCAKLPADRALAPFAAHGGLRQPLRSAHASALALRGRLRAKSRAFSAIVVRKGAPLPHAPAGAVPHPLLAAFAAWPALLRKKMQGFATAIFFPGRFFLLLYLFQQSVPQMRISIGFLSHLKFLNTTRFDFSIGSLPPFTSSFYSNSHHFVSRATTRIRPLSLWLSQVLTSKAVRPTAHRRRRNKAIPLFQHFNKSFECLLCLRLCL